MCPLQAPALCSAHAIQRFDPKDGGGRVSGRFVLENKKRKETEKWWACAMIMGVGKFKWFFLGGGGEWEGCQGITPPPPPTHTHTHTASHLCYWLFFATSDQTHWSGPGMGPIARLGEADGSKFLCSHLFTHSYIHKT